MRILLVEDEPRAAQMLARGLREQTYAVDVTGDTVTVPFRAYDIKTLVVSMRAGGSDTPAVPGSRNSRGRGRPRSSH